MGTSSKVALIHCCSYEIKDVRNAISAGLEYLGGVGNYARRSEKILIKPNLLVGEPPANCVNPHPVLFRALVEQIKSTGAIVSYGDSPAVGPTQLAARQSGMLAVAEDLGVELADFKTPKLVNFPEGNLIKHFSIATGALEADGIISLSKMKSHALTRITGAVKNQFGCVPGVLKPEFHTTLPNPSLFSQMLVDLNLLLKPRLYVMDGVMAMEGNGPRNGTPRQMNVILLSSDPIALDTVFCRLVNLDESLVETINFGNQYGLGSSNVEVLGESIDAHRAVDFVVNRDRAMITDNQGAFFSRFIRRFISPRPVINETLCIKCGKCEEICPAVPKALSWKNGKKSPPIYDYAQCIRCYCCQETCPHQAISVKSPFLGKLIKR